MDPLRFVFFCHAMRLVVVAHILMLCISSQNTVTRDGEEVSLRGKGRHDPCVLPRAIPMVEAMMALTLIDHLMMQQAQCELFPNEATDINPMGTTVKGFGTAGKPVVAASGQRIDEE